MIDPETLAAENGFSHWAQMNMAAVVPLAEVRDMCAADRCGRYGAQLGVSARLRQP